MVSVNCGNSTGSWKHWRWVRLDLIFTKRDKYINSNLNLLTKFTSNSRITELEYIFPWNISQMITTTIPTSKRIVMSYTMKWGIPFWLLRKVKRNWDNNMIRISQSREIDCTTNISVWRKKEIQKRTVRVTVRDPRRKVKHLSKVIWDRKIDRAHQVYQVHHNRLASP